MKSYNGHRSWNAWNVSLWINNDEPTYNRAYDLVTSKGARIAARLLLKELPARTPDGAVYNYTSVYNAIVDIL